MITLSDYYMNRDKEYPTDLTEKIATNAASLLIKVNELLNFFGSTRSVNSGWRPRAVQMKVNPKAMGSKHISGNAIDLEDKDGKLKEWCVFNQATLEELGLYMEHPSATPTWVHLQQVPPASGNRIFKP